MSILVVVPQPEELEPLVEALRAAGHVSGERLVGRLDAVAFADLDAVIALGGHGKVQLAVQTQHLLEQMPAVGAVVCAGAAGSLVAEARWGDVVVGSSTVEHDYRLRFVSEPPPVHIADQGLVQQMLAAVVADRPYRVLHGPIASGDEDIVERQRAEELHRATGALCVAWEGAGAARAAAFSGRAFVELRVITDACDAGAARNYHESMEAVMPHVAEVLARWMSAPHGQPEDAQPCPQAQR